MGAKSIRAYKKRDLDRAVNNIDWAIGKVASYHEEYTEGAPEISTGLVVAVEMLNEAKSLINKINEEI